MPNQKPTSVPRRKKRHAAARSRVLAAVLSVATFLGLGGTMAIRSAATAATSSSAASTTSSSSKSSTGNSTSNSGSGSTTSSDWSATPAMPSSGGSVVSGGS